MMLLVQFADENKRWRAIGSVSNLLLIFLNALNGLEVPVSSVPLTHQ